MSISFLVLSGSVMAGAAPSTSKVKIRHHRLTLKEAGRNSGTAMQLVHLVEKPVAGTEVAKKRHLFWRTLS